MCYTSSSCLQEGFVGLATFCYNPQRVDTSQQHLHAYVETLILCNNCTCHVLPRAKKIREMIHVL
jgi:hypothetical protein